MAAARRTAKGRNAERGGTRVRARRERRMKASEKKGDCLTRIPLDHIGGAERQEQEEKPKKKDKCKKVITGQIAKSGGTVGRETEKTRIVQSV